MSQYKWTIGDYEIKQKTNEIIILAFFNTHNNAKRALDWIDSVITVNNK